MRNLVLRLVLAAGLCLPVVPARGEEADAPVPASGVAAAETVETAESAAPAPAPVGAFARVAEVFDRGGFIMWVLLGMSVVGGAFAAERFMALRRVRQLPDGLMDRLRAALRDDGIGGARSALAGDDSALARVMDAVLARSGATRRELESAVDDEAGRVYCGLRENLRPVGLVATLAPLLGLLGTVFGLISAFRHAAEMGMDDPRNFAGGIYEALYTTAFGLVVAIPFLVVHNALKGRAETVARAAEAEALEFVLSASARRATPPRDDAGEKAA